MNGTTFALYTTKTGGIFKVTALNREQYDQAVEDGVLRLPTDLDAPDPHVEVEFKFIAFVRVEDNFDAVLGCSRDDEAGITRWNEQHPVSA